jgi:hypothetical protein
MRCRGAKYRWLNYFLFIGLLCGAACSTQQQNPQDDLAVNTADPFADPFFTQPPTWDGSVLQQSEVLTEEPGEPQKPKSFLERSEGVLVSTLIVGVSLAKLAVPFIGF